MKNGNGLFFLLLIFLITSPMAGPNENAAISVDLIHESEVIENTFSTHQNNITVAVRASDVDNLDTYDFTLSFDTARVSLTGVFEENAFGGLVNILKTNGGTTIFLGPDANSMQEGKIIVGNTLNYDDPAQAPEGSGLLALLMFETKNQLGPCNISIEKATFINHEGTSDSITNRNAAILTITEDPSSLVFGQFGNDRYILNQNWETLGDGSDNSLRGIDGRRINLFR